MNQPLRFTSAASLIVLGSIIAGCAAPQSRLGAANHFGGKADVDTGLATRALAAFNANNLPLAIQLAERAVAKTPKDAGFRALLGNAYFASGRFHSAEQAFRDALTLYPDQPRVVLKLALVQIAQGKNREAIALLDDSRGQLDASDYGLALALAGRPGHAIAVLEPAARQTGADATVRQNLALAYALAGDWSQSRIVASQDVPGNQIDARIHQWMQLASPAHASDQVAALVGVTPAAVDAGQPVQIALNKDQPQLPASAAPASQQLANAAPAPAPARAVAVAAAAPKPTFVAVAKPAPAPAPVLAVAPAPPPPRSTLATIASNAVADAKAVFAAVLPHSHAPAAKPAKARLAAAVRPAAHAGKSTAVVQLGAYGSPQRVLAAWNGAAHKYAALKAYLPMSARFASAKGTFYRLSVRGFDSPGQAVALCSAVRRQGGNCFVRNSAGDAPVNYAMR
jgi:Flp pilus assembly protein TadD